MKEQLKDIVITLAAIGGFLGLLFLGHKLPLKRSFEGRQDAWLSGQ